MPHLNTTELNTLIAILCDVVQLSDYTGGTRDSYLVGIPSHIRADMPKLDAPRNQLLSDVGHLNDRIIPIRQMQGDDQPLVAYLRIILLLRTHEPRASELQAFVDRISAGGVKGDLTETLNAHHNSKLPLLNRSGLRGLLRRMHEHKILTLSIRGRRRSGKSFSRYFIQPVALSAGVRFAFVDAQRSMTFSPSEFVERLTAELGIPMVPYDATAPKTRQIKQLLDELIRARHSVARPVWIVLDHFDDEAVEPETQRLIDSLVDAADRDQFLPMILLGYEQSKSADRFPLNVERDDIGDIDEAAVRRHVEQFLLATATIEAGAVDAAIDNINAFRAGMRHLSKTESLARAVAQFEEAMLGNGQPGAGEDDDA